MWPLHEVGALLDARAVHPGRSAYDHLHSLAAANGIARKRVDEVLEMVGLASVARKRAGGFSLGMFQRLGIAGALLGDPGTLLFDEPVNGLDPEGIIWIRALMRSLAAEGRTVLVSSHLMSEMALTADHLLVIGRGRMIADMPQVHHLGSAVQDVPEKAPLDGVQRGPGRGLREQVVVLVDVLARRSLPCLPVRLRHRVHSVRVSACGCRCQRLYARAALPQRRWSAGPP